MNKLGKYLKKSNQKERTAILDVLEQLSKGNMVGLDLKKLKGYDNYFRARKGKTRIIFHLDVNGKPVIQSIEKRDDNTYSF